jgi:hypothetical protein
MPKKSVNAADAKTVGQKVDAVKAITTTSKADEKAPIKVDKKAVKKGTITNAGEGSSSGSKTVVPACWGDASDDESDGKTVKDLINTLNEVSKAEFSQHAGTVADLVSGLLPTLCGSREALGEVRLELNTALTAMKKLSIELGGYLQSFTEIAELLGDVYNEHVKNVYDQLAKCSLPGDMQLVVTPKDKKEDEPEVTTVTPTSATTWAGIASTTAPQLGKHIASTTAPQLAKPIDCKTYIGNIPVADNNGKIAVKKVDTGIPTVTTAEAADFLKRNPGTLCIVTGEHGEIEYIVIKWRGRILTASGIRVCDRSNINRDPCIHGDNVAAHGRVGINGCTFYHPPTVENNGGHKPFHEWNVPVNRMPLLNDILTLDWLTHAKTYSTENPAEYNEFISTGAKSDAMFVMVMLNTILADIAIPDEASRAVLTNVRRAY